MRKAILTTGLALAATLAVGCGRGAETPIAVRDSGTPANARTPANTAARPSAPDGHAQGETAGGVRRITIEEARAAVDAGTAVFLDVRPDDAYRMGHIKGALSIPEGTVAARASELPKDKLIITYCA